MEIDPHGAHQVQVTTPLEELLMSIEHILKQPKFATNCPQSYGNHAERPVIKIQFLQDMSSEYTGVIGVIASMVWPASMVSWRSPAGKSRPWGWYQFFWRPSIWGKLPRPKQRWDSMDSRHVMIIDISNHEAFMLMLKHIPHVIASFFVVYLFEWLCWTFSSLLRHG